MMRFAARAVSFALVISAGGCISVSTPSFLRPAPERDWKATLQQSRALAAERMAPQADSLLARYAAAYPGSAGATESLYWRALFQIQAGSAPAGASQMLSAYLGQPGVEHRVEADALLQAASRIDALSQATSTLATRVQLSNGETASAANRAADAKADVKAANAEAKEQEAEIRKLRAELAASKEELDRIKKRLAEPPKKPPVR